MSIGPKRATLPVELTVMGGSALAQEHTIELRHFLGAKAPVPTQMLEPWARQFEETSDGKVMIEKDRVADVGRIWLAADEHGIEVATEAGNAHVTLTETAHEKIAGNSNGATN